MEEKYIFLITAIILYILVVYLFSRLAKNREIGPRRLFWISLFLTPVLGLALLLSSHELKMKPYTEQNYKCERCGYIFSESYPHCPFCEKEGHTQELKPVNKFMT
ncbi:MAG: hypothetical protein JW731_05735 [Bacteroidales bacterium]|nr:hypothetical protein [Bacteroidales bacterium]